MAEMEDKAPAYREALLVTDPSVEPCRRRCKSKDSRLLVVVGVALILMAALFVGGWFAGRQYEKVDEKAEANTQQQNQQSQYNNMVRVTQNSDGTAMTKPVLGGSRPVYDFVQCNYADGTVCQSANPLLTPKGTIQLTLYQYMGNTSFIVTSTGEKYGELATLSRRRRSTTPAPSVNYNNFLHLKNCNGMLETPDKSRPPFSPVQTSSEMRIPFSYSSTSSHTHIIHLNGEIPSGGCQLSFENAPDGHHFSIRGGDDIMTSDSDSIPVEPNRMTLEDVTKTVTPFLDSPIDMDQFKPFQFTPAVSDAPDFYMAPLDFGVRKKRSFFSTLKKDVGTVYQAIHPITKAIQSTIQVIHDVAHGGSNGTITYDVTNHTTNCRSRFSMLYHDGLRDIHGIVSNASAVKTFLFRHENSEGIRNLSMWQSITPNINMAASSYVNLINHIPGDLPCFKQEFNEIQGRVKSFLDSFKSSSAGRRKRFLGLHWNCGLTESLERGYECGKGAYSCGSDVAEGDVTFGLSIIKAGRDCYGAGKSCYGLVHNCISGHFHL